MAGYDEQPVGRMIYFMAQDIRNLAERILAPHDLTLEQFQTLKALSPTTGITQRQLCLAIKKNPANMTRILDRLEAKGFISRQQAPQDRRAYLVLLTKSGSLMMEEVDGVFEKFSAGIHQGLTAEMKRTTRKLLAIMAANAERMTAALKNDEK